MSKELDTTFYRFQSEVRAFLAKLLKNPVDAQPSKYLKDREFTRKKLINELLSRDVIERHEKILDRTNSDEKDAKYVVKFKIHKKDFEKRLHRMYIKFFEKNVNESVFENEEEMKKQILNGPDGDVYRKRGGINEEGEGGGMAAGGDGSGGATSTSSVASETTRGDLGYDVPFGQVQRRGIYVGAQGEKRSTNPILGKTITAEAKKGRRIYITEEQYQRILEEEGLGGATTTFSVGSETTRGDMGYDAPFPGKGKKKNKFLDPALDRTPGGICINQMDDETKKRK